MEKKDNKGLMNRRNMLKSFGIAGAAVAAAPIFGAGTSVLKAANFLPNPAAPMKVGLLLPASSNYSTSFLNGYNLYLDQLVASGGTIPFVTVMENISSGPSSANAKLAKLITEQGITVAVGLMNSRVSKFLVQPVEDADINFVEANIGENFFDKNILSDRFFQSSLNLWQSHYMLGMYAATQGNRTICATSFVDSGYDALYAFEAGFLAGGGTLAASVISGNPTTNMSPVEAAIACASSDATIIFANYSGSDASVFLSALRNAGAAQAIYSSGMLIQQRVLSFTGTDATGVKSAHSWDFASAPLFDSAYATKYNSQADDFAVLGYDTAIMLCSAAAQMTRSLNPATFGDALSNMEINSPRGVVKMNAGTHAVEAPIQLMDMQNDGTNIVSHIFSTGAIPAALTSSSYRLTEAMGSGATMPYPGL